MISGKYVKNEYYAEEDIPEKSVDVEIAIRLKEKNLAFKVEKYSHSYPHCWRTDKPVLYYPLDSWFIKVSAFKQDKIIASYYDSGFGVPALFPKSYFDILDLS